MSVTHKFIGKQNDLINGKVLASENMVKILRVFPVRFLLGLRKI